MGLASLWPAPIHTHGHCDHVHRLAGPDYELGAVRGLRPATVALAGVVAFSIALAHCRAVHCLRLRTVSIWPILPGGLGSSQDSGSTAGRLIRLAPSADQSWHLDLRGRVYRRHVSRSRSDPHRSVQLLAGDTVRLDLRRYTASIPAAVGIRFGHPGDDSRGNLGLPR